MPQLTVSQNPVDKSATKRTLGYWIELAKLLDKGGFNALFLADTYGGYDTYEGSLDNCIRRAAQWPVTDPTIVSLRLRLRGVDTGPDHCFRLFQQWQLLLRNYRSRSRHRHRSSPLFCLRNDFPPWTTSPRADSGGTLSRLGRRRHLKQSGWRILLNMMKDIARLMNILTYSISKRLTPTDRLRAGPDS